MEGKIRPLAVAIIENQGKYFVIAGRDEKINKDFYRAPGGGIEFGETGTEALVREMQEEFAVEISEIEYLGTVENIFEYNNKPGHEICLIYRAKITDEELLKKEKSKVLDSETDYGVWVDREKLEAVPFYPDGSIKYL